MKFKTLRICLVTKKGNVYYKFVMINAILALIFLLKIKIVKKLILLFSIVTFLYPPQNVVLGGYTVFSLSMIP